MASRPSGAPEQALRRLQSLVRRSPPAQGERTVLTRILPPDLATEDVKVLLLLPDEKLAFEHAKAAVVADLRFEHLRDADDEVWRFICQTYLERSADHIHSFVATHAREIVDATCYLPVESLRVERDYELFGVRLLPTADERVPSEEPGFSLQAPTGSVAMVACKGTHYGCMSTRATECASHALRLLRVALREHPMIAQSQLRFRLGIGYAFGDGLVGWKRRDDEPFELGLNEELVELALEQQVALVPLEPRSDIQRKANLAVQWMERGSLASEPLPALLFLFFALEALLGDKAAGLKAQTLALGQATLDHLVTGTFTHPNKIYFLYDVVRSGAVHGEAVSGVGWDTVTQLQWIVRQTLNHFLTYARENQFAKRGRLLQSLDHHPDRAKLLDELRERGGTHWATYQAEA